MTPTTAPTQAEAAIEDLYLVPDKRRAELVNGRIVILPYIGMNASQAKGALLVSLKAHEKKTELGKTYTSRVAFVVDLPHRKSFSPDIAFTQDKRNFGMRFPEGSPTFAVEIRNELPENNFPETEIEQKRADYFAAGTLVVWDVDLLSEDVVRVYRAATPDTPTVYRRGDIAEAEPAVPGWTMPVNDLFA